MPAEQEEKNWGAEPWRAPKIEAGDEVVVDECGRIIQVPTLRNRIDCRSHWFRMVIGGPLDHAYLLVSHGGGQERIDMGFWSRHIVDAMHALDSDSRYLILHELYDMYGYGRAHGAEKVRNEYTRALHQGRLKTRKVRGQAAEQVLHKSEGGLSWKVVATFSTALSA